MRPLPLLFLWMVLLTPVIESERPAVPDADMALRVGVADDGNNTTREYHTYESTVAELSLLVRDHPDIAAMKSIGTTYERRTIWAVKLSKDPGIEDPEKPEILLMGATHAREWISLEVPLYFVEWVTSNYGKKGENGTIATWLLRNREIWVVPIVNPDGFAYSRAHDNPNDNGGWRKNRRPNFEGPLGTVSSIGVDDNRNFGYMWGEFPRLGTTSHNPNSDTFEGPFDLSDNDGDGLIDEDPMDSLDNDRDGKIDEDKKGGFSEEETLAIKRLAEGHRFAVSISFHSYSNLVLYPWGYTGDPTPDDALLREIATNMSKYNNYTVEQAYGLYKTSGDSDDYLYGALHVLAFTIEIGTEGFHPPAKDIMKYASENLGAQVYAAEIADNPLRDNPVVNHTQAKTRVKAGEPLSVKATVTSPVPFPVDGVRVFFSTGGEYRSVVMKPTGKADEYAASIPPQAPGSKVRYYIRAQDALRHNGTAPKYAPVAAFTYEVEGGLTLAGGQGCVVGFISLAMFVAGLFYWTSRWPKGLPGRLLKRFLWFHRPR